MAQKEQANPLISVVIPTFNRAKMVLGCVRSVLATNYPSLEVVVVDDCSSDDTGEQIRAAFGDDPRVRYTRNETNKLTAASRNVGARLAHGDFLFILDNDNAVEPNIFTELLAAFERHPNAGLVAPVSVHQSATRRGIVWTLGSDFNRWTSQPVEKFASAPLSELPKEPIDWPTTYSPNAFLIRRDVFNQIGGFDESLVIIYEESDFGWRLCEAGYESFITTKTRTNHFGYLEPGCVAPLRQLGIERPNRAYYLSRNRLRFARRHFAWYQAIVVALVFAPLSALWYGRVALANKRPDIAWAYLRGTLRGILGLA